MLFGDLVICNKSWSDTTDLIIISQTDKDATPMRCRAARTIFKDRQVLWFKDDVVMLL